MEDRELLRAIRIICSDYLNSSVDLLSSSKEVFDQIMEITNIVVEEGDDVQKVLIYCDASAKKNPGGPCAVGYVILDPSQKKPIASSMGVPSTTINQAEYDAIYVALTSYFNLVNRPKYNIVIYSDSALVVNQLNGVYEVNDEKLKNKKESILEFCAPLPVKVSYHWLPRNSTPELKQANNMAQSFLGIKNH